jgi:hypothetical protein
VESSESSAATQASNAGNLATTVPAAIQQAPLGQHTRLALTLLAGVGAGFASWIVGESAIQAFQPRMFRVQVVLQTFIQSTTASENAADLKNSILAFAILGASIGLAMGIAGGLTVRSPARGVAVGLGAGAVGGLVGGLAAAALLPLFYRSFVPDPNDWLPSILIHSCIWAAAGAVAALAFAIAQRSWARVPHVILGACVGAVLATIVYHFLAENYLANSGPADANARTPISRLVARLLVCVLIAAGTARGALVRASSKSRVANEL